MKNMLLFIAILLLGISSATTRAEAKPYRQTYKCYLDTSWTPQIGYFSWYPKDTRINLAGLPGKKLPASPMTGNRSPYIKRVIECVPEGTRFSNSKARKLEKSISDLS